MKALVFGSLNLDYVYSVSHFVQPGETMASDCMQIFCGGKGLNQALAFCRSGVDTWHAGAVGADDGKILIQYLNKSGVHTDFIQQKESSSGHAVIQKTPEGENSILLNGGANQLITEAYVDFVLPHFTKGDYLVLQNEINQIPYIMEQAHQIGMHIVLNPSPMDEKIWDMPLSYVDFLILNELEGAALAGGPQQDDEKMLGQLMERFPDAKIVLTLGKGGSVYGYKNQTCYQPVYPVEAVDTTAAGDTFMGFFMGSVIQGKEVGASLKIAAKAAAIAVGRNGAGVSIPDRKEVEASWNC